MNIAFIGKMSSGKTTASQYLVDNYGYKKLSLAEPIYWIVNDLKNKTPRELYSLYIAPYLTSGFTDKELDKFIAGIDYVNKNIPREQPKPRKQLQFIGTEVGRGIRDTLWVDILLNRVTGDNNTVDDVRFSNELQYLKNAGFILIKLEITKEEQKIRLSKLYKNFDPEILNHGSEIEIDALLGDYSMKSDADVFKNIDHILKEAR
jgi:hypothetical protein